MLGLIKYSWLESGGVYGYREVYQDLHEAGEAYGKHRLARLMSRKVYALRRAIDDALAAYGGGKPTIAFPNHLGRQF
ncbi:hypothetical protein CEK60_00550 [Halomonas sp. N3-2A]|nr:hypothetical protein CEK60_00550 [Halomonas sp. N3-2A]